MKKHHHDHKVGAGAHAALVAGETVAGRPDRRQGRCRVLRSWTFLLAWHFSRDLTEHPRIWRKRKNDQSAYTNMFFQKWTATLELQPAAMPLHAEKPRMGHFKDSGDTIGVLTTDSRTAPSDSLVYTAAVPVSIGREAHCASPSAPKLIPYHGGHPGINIFFKVTLKSYQNNSF